MAVLDQVVADALAAVRAGRNVRIAGKRLSGRSTALRTVVAELESTGVRVISAAGDRLAAEQPGYVLEHLRSGLGVTPRARDLASTIDALAAALTADDVFALDDPHLIDALSLRAIAALRQRLGFRIVLTECAGRLRDAELPTVWPETVVPVPDLDLPRTAAVLQDLLGEPVEQRTLTLLFSSSGGVLGLLLALADSARTAGLLVREGAQWRAPNGELWNPHLAPLLDGLLAELAPEERGLIEWIAADGPVTIEEARTRADAATLARVLQLKFVAPAGLSESERVQVWPPLLAQRFRAAPRVGATRSGPGDDVSGLGEVLLGERPSHPLALLARAFAVHDEELAASAYRSWSLTPTLRNAIHYLQTAMGMPAETARVRTVLARTRFDPQRRSAPANVLLAFRKLDWLLFEERDLAASRELLEASIALLPEHEFTLRTGAAALGVLNGEPAPSSPEHIDFANADVSLVSVSLGLALVRGDLPRVRAGLEAAGDRPDFRPIAAYLEPAVLLLNGEVRAALELAELSREDARRRLDRAEFCILSYVSALCAQHLGEYELLDRVLSEAAVVGRPRVVWGIVYSAFLTIRAGAAHFTGQTALRDSLLREATSYAPETGPYLGMGTDFITATVQHSDDPDRFGALASACVEARLSRNFLVGAVQTAVSGLELVWRAELAHALLRAAERVHLPAYARAVSVTERLLARDLAGVRAVLAEAGDDAEDRALLLRMLGAALRAFRAEAIAPEPETETAAGAEPAPDAETAADAEPAAEAVRAAADAPRVAAQAASGPVPGADSEIAEELLSIITAEFGEAVGYSAAERALAQLSAREREIGRLGGQLSNLEIAERLRLSKRTVENHISNALRKTGLTNRAELAELLLTR